MRGCLLLLLLLAGCARPPPPLVPQPRYEIGQPYQLGGAWSYPREEFGLMEAGLGVVLAAAAPRRTRVGEVFDDGAMVAAHDAFSQLVARGTLAAIPLKHFVAAISVGMYRGMPVLDLDYEEDSGCDTDMNVVMTDAGHFIEVQGTAEGAAFDRAGMDRLLDLAQGGIADLIRMQKDALGLAA